PENHANNVSPDLVNITIRVQTLYAVDLNQPISESDAWCFKISQYSAVFLRAFAPFQSDGFESSVCQSIWNAKQADLGVEVFMTPTRPSFNDGAEQFDQLYKGLQGCQINVASVWLQVVSPVDWMFQPQASVDFINQVIAQANNYGVNIGIYTSQKEWMEITYGTNDLYAPTRLWYWNVNSPGPLGETPANFSDFSAFGPWTSPVVKQFGQGIPICGHTVNRD
ncbi:hypothetical protein ANCCEY_01804, partial [Ancylostoma ceylanicum]